MPLQLNIIQDLVLLYAIILVGYAAKKKNVLNQDSDKLLTNLVFYITLPALILYSMDFDFSISLLQDFAWLILFSCYALASASICAYILGKRSGLPKDKNGVFQSLIIFGNQGFLGYAVCYSLFAKQGIIYAAIYNLLFLFLIWTYGVYLIANHKTNYT